MNKESTGGTFSFPQEYFLQIRPSFTMLSNGNRYAAKVLAALIRNFLFFLDAKNNWKRGEFDGEKYVFQASHEEIASWCCHEVSPRTIRDICLPLLVTFGYVEVKRLVYTYEYSFYPARVQHGLTLLREKNIPGFIDWIRNSFTAGMNDLFSQEDYQAGNELVKAQMKRDDMIKRASPFISRKYIEAQGNVFKLFRIPRELLVTLASRLSQKPVDSSETDSTESTEECDPGHEEKAPILVTAAYSAAPTIQTPALIEPPREVKVLDDVNVENAINANETELEHIAQMVNQEETTKERIYELATFFEPSFQKGPRQIQAAMRLMAAQRSHEGRGYTLHEIALIYAICSDTKNACDYREKIVGCKERDSKFKGNMTLVMLPDWIDSRLAYWSERTCSYQSSVKRVGANLDEYEDSDVFIYPVGRDESDPASYELLSKAEIISHAGVFLPPTNHVISDLWVQVCHQTKNSGPLYEKWVGMYKSHQESRNNRVAALNRRIGVLV